MKKVVLATSGSLGAITPGVYGCLQSDGTRGRTAVTQSRVPRVIYEPHFSSSNFIQRRQPVHGAYLPMGGTGRVRASWIKVSP